MCAQLFSIGIHRKGQRIALNLAQLRGKRLKNALQLGITRQVNALHLHGQGRGRTRGDNKARCQTLIDSQQDGIGQRRLVSALHGALLALITQPQAPLGLPLTIGFARNDRQQGIGGVALGGFTQGSRIIRSEVFRNRHQLLGKISQWQAQRQTTVLRGLIKRRSRSLAITKQTTAIASITQPPQQDARAIGAPQRQTGLTQAAIGAQWIKVDQQFVAFIAILTNDLLRFLVQRRQGRVLRRIGFAGQAQHQGVQRTA